jgi:hypothetical protein
MNSPEGGGEEPEKQQGKSEHRDEATDEELVDHWIEHLANPCWTTLRSGDKVTLAAQWIREAEHVLPFIVNDDQRKRLESAIKMAKVFHKI